MKATTIGLLCLAALGPATARGDQVFLREADAPRALFGEGITYEREVLALSGAELAALSRALGRRVEVARYPYLEVSSGAAGPEGGRRVLGWVFPLDVIGQSLPITFAVGVKADGSLQDIQVMVYREPHGDEIRDRRFRAQFAGKTLKQPLVVGKDIDAVSGATISSRSAAYAARKGLALADVLRRRAGGSSR